MRSPDRFSLHEIDPSVEERAQREFSGFREPRAGLHRILDDLLQHDRASVGANLDAVITGIRVGSGEMGRDHLVARGSSERCVARHEGRLQPEERRRDGERSRAAQPDDANPAAPRRSGNSDDGIFGAEHRNGGDVVSAVRRTGPG